MMAWPMATALLRRSSSSRATLLPIAAFIDAEHADARNPTALRLAESACLDAIRPIVEFERRVNGGSSSNSQSMMQIEVFDNIKRAKSIHKIGNHDVRYIFQQQPNMPRKLRSKRKAAKVRGHQGKKRRKALSKSAHRWMDGVDNCTAPSRKNKPKGILVVCSDDHRFVSLLRQAKSKGFLTVVAVNNGTERRRKLQWYERQQQEEDTDVPLLHRSGDIVLGPFAEWVEGCGDDAGEESSSPSLDDHTYARNNEDGYIIRKVKSAPTSLLFNNAERAVGVPTVHAIPGSKDGHRFMSERRHGEPLTDGSADKQVPVWWRLNPSSSAAAKSEKEDGAKDDSALVRFGFVAFAALARAFTARLGLTKPNHPSLDGTEGASLKNEQHSYDRLDNFALTSKTPNERKQRSAGFYVPAKYVRATGGSSGSGSTTGSDRGGGLRKRYASAS